MSRSARRELDSRVAVLMAHLLKWQFQPERSGGSWRRTIAEQRRSIRALVRRHPSLGREVDASILQTYEKALRLAEQDAMYFREVMPSVCPFSVDQVLDPNYLPPPERI